MIFDLKLFKLNEKGGTKMTLTEKRNRLFTLNYEKFNTCVLSRKKAAIVLNKSTGTLDLWRKEQYGPPSRKDTRSRNGSVTYLLDDLIDFLVYES